MESLFFLQLPFKYTHSGLVRGFFKKIKCSDAKEDDRPLYEVMLGDQNKPK